MKFILLFAICLLLSPAATLAQKVEVVRSASLEEVVSSPRWLSLPHSRLIVNPSPPGATLTSGISDPALTMNLAYYVGESPVMLPGFLAWQVGPFTSALRSDADVQLGFAPREENNWEKFGVTTDFSGTLRMTSTGPYGSIARDVTVDLDQAPTMAISIAGGTGGWAVKVRAEGEADVPLIASDGPQTGVFTADIASITGWKGQGKRTFKLVLFAVGKNQSVAVEEVRFLKLPGRVSSVKTRWYPHQIRTEAAAQASGRRIETTTVLPDTNTVTQRLRIKTGDADSIRLMGDFRNGNVLWDAKRELLHLRDTRYSATLAFSRRAHWQGVRGSGIEWVSGKSEQSTESGVWALDFDCVKTGDDIIVVARFSPTPATSKSDEAAVKRLAKTAAFDDALRRQEATWDRLLARLPHPLDFTVRSVDAKGMPPEALRRTYYRAWVFLLAGILPPMLENDFPFPQFPTGKPSLWNEGAPKAKPSAQWESFVAMQALALVTPQTAWDAYSGLMSLVGKDGALNGEGLPSCHAQTAWVLYQLTGDKARLRASYPALKRLLLWKAANPRWIYKGSTPPSQKDQQFVLYVLQDMHYARRIAASLEMPDEAAVWSAQQSAVASDFHRWFWETPGGTPYRIFDSETGKRTGGNNPWNLTALELPISVLTVPAKDSLLQSFRSQFRPDVPFLVSGLSRWADYIGTQRGLFQYGHISESLMMAEAGMRDVTLAGEFSETYNQGVSPPKPDGVRPSVFGTRFLIDGAFWSNGVVFDEGLPVLVGVPGASGIRGLLIRGRKLDISFRANEEVLLQGSALGLLRIPPGFTALESSTGSPQWKGHLPVGKRISLEEKTPPANNRKSLPAQR